MRDLEALSDGELALYLSRGMAALDFTATFEERQKLAHWLIRVRLEQDWRDRSRPWEFDRGEGPRVTEMLREVLRRAG
jgi:hypothetical protein